MKRLDMKPPPSFCFEAPTPGATSEDDAVAEAETRIDFRELKLTPEFTPSTRKSGDHLYNLA